MDIGKKKAILQKQNQKKCKEIIEIKRKVLFKEKVERENIFG